MPLLTEELGLPSDALPFDKIAALPNIPKDPNKTEEQEQEENEEKQRYEEFFDFNKAKPFLKSLKDDFDKEVNVTNANRERRRIDIDIKAEQDAGRLKKSDTFIPQRIIDESIAREKPALIAYIQQSRRLAVFTDVADPDTKHDALESAFTRGMQYDGWLNSHVRVVDGGQLNGWDWTEILFDTTKPLFCNIEHVGHDRLIFPLDSEDIQNCARVMRHYRWTRLQLTTFVKKYGFSKVQVQKVIQSNQQKGIDAGATKDRVFDIYKVYFKYDGCVYVGWMSLNSCDDWLLAPAKFYNGVDTKVTTLQPQPPLTTIDPNTGNLISLPQPPVPTEEWQQVDETEYPFSLYVHEVIEEKEISKTKGRAFKDKFKQEAMTVGWTSTMNAAIRSTWVMGSKAENDGKPASQLQSLEMGDGKIHPFKIDWAKMPAVQPEMLQVLQVLDSRIASGNGQMNYAVQNKSSGARTTKAEVDQANQDTNQLSSVSVSMFANYVRHCCTKAWRIVQSQALQNTIILFGEYVTGAVNPVTGVPDTEPEFQNYSEIIERKFEIKPAGDVDYIQRNELIRDMMEFWPVVANTVIAGDFLAHLLKIKFAELGDLWAKKLLAGDPTIMLLQQCLQILTGLMTNPADAVAMTPEHKQNLAMLIAQITQTITPTTKPNESNSRTAESTTNTGGSIAGGGNNSSQGSMVPATADKQNVSGIAKAA